MSKIPFDIKFRPQIESGEYKVETRDGRVVHNIWRVKEPSYTNNRKMEVCALIDGEEDALVFFEGGRYLPTTKDTDNPFDLLIITPESELSEFESKDAIISHIEVKQDPMLSWEDIAVIDSIILDTNNELAVDYSKEISRQKFYEEVLTRFKEQRKK